MPNKFLSQQYIHNNQHTSVVERVIYQIKEAISLGQFQMGDRLPNEFELMEQFNVSRNSLREAMKILSTIGIVEVRRGDGTYICTEVKPNISDFLTFSILLEKSSPEEIIELRQMLDEDILVLAVKRCTYENILELQDLIDRMRKHFQKGELSEAARLDYQFHLYLCNCCQNSFLSRIVSNVYYLFEGSIENNIRSVEEFAAADLHHQGMLECIKNRDFQRIPDVVEEALTSWSQNVRVSYQAGQ